MEFEFKMVREIPDWGTVLELPSVSMEMDGAPIVNEFGRLVGITRVRWVDGELVSFGLPVRWLFDLLRGTLMSKLAYLREWETWRSANWDSLNRMTREELASKLANEELAAQLVAERERIEELEAELIAEREIKKSSGAKGEAPPKASRQKAWSWLIRLLGG